MPPFIRHHHNWSPHRSSGGNNGALGPVSALLYMFFFIVMFLAHFGPVQRFILLFVSNYCDTTTSTDCIRIKINNNEVPMREYCGYACVTHGEQRDVAAYEVTLISFNSDNFERNFLIFNSRLETWYTNINGPISLKTRSLYDGAYIWRVQPLMQHKGSSALDDNFPKFYTAEKYCKHIEVKDGLQCDCDVKFAGICEITANHNSTNNANREHIELYIESSDGRYRSAALEPYEHEFYQEALQGMEHGRDVKIVTAHREGFGFSYSNVMVIMTQPSCLEKKYLPNISLSDATLALPLQGTQFVIDNKNIYRYDMMCEMARTRSADERSELKTVVTHRCRLQSMFYAWIVFFGVFYLLVGDPLFVKPDSCSAIVHPSNTGHIHRYFRHNEPHRRQTLYYHVPCEESREAFERLEPWFDIVLMLALMIPLVLLIIITVSHRIKKIHVFRNIWQRTCTALTGYCQRIVNLVSTCMQRMRRMTTWPRNRDSAYDNTSSSISNNFNQNENHTEQPTDSICNCNSPSCQKVEVFDNFLICRTEWDALLLAPPYSQSGNVLNKKHSTTNKPLSAVSHGNISDTGTLDTISGESVWFQNKSYDSDLVSSMGSSAARLNAGSSRNISIENISSSSKETLNSAVSSSIHFENLSLRSNSVCNPRKVYSALSKSSLASNASPAVETSDL